MKTHIVLIHGGETFDTYDEYVAFLRGLTFDESYLYKKRWKNSLAEHLGNTFEVLAPEMPSKWNAKYAEWSIWFEKIIPFLADELILIGHSLGGIFLAKYLSENKFPKKIRATFLIAAPFDDTESEYSLADFVLPNTLELLTKQGGKIIIYHSVDDPVVPFTDAEKYTRSLPSATLRTFPDKGHFSQEHFPELVEDIQKLV